jgi:hypothetical protein
LSTITQSFQGRRRGRRSSEQYPRLEGGSLLHPLQGAGGNTAEAHYDRMSIIVNMHAIVKLSKRMKMLGLTRPCTLSELITIAGAHVELSQS